MGASCPAPAPAASKRMPYWTPGSERYDLDAIRWLFEHEGLAISESSPIRKALTALERMESDAPLLPGEPALHQFITTKMAQVLGWSIRALWGEGAPPGACADKTFIKQLQMPDLEGG